MHSSFSFFTPSAPPSSPRYEREDLSYESSKAVKKLWRSHQSQASKEIRVQSKSSLESLEKAMDQLGSKGQKLIELFHQIETLELNSSDENIKKHMELAFALDSLAQKTLEKKGKELGDLHYAYGRLFSRLDLLEKNLLYSLALSIKAYIQHKDLEAATKLAFEIEHTSIGLQALMEILHLHLQEKNMASSISILSSLHSSPMLSQELQVKGDLFKRVYRQLARHLINNCSAQESYHTIQSIQNEEIKRSLTKALHTVTHKHRNKEKKELFIHYLEILTKDVKKRELHLNLNNKAKAENQSIEVSQELIESYLHQKSFDLAYESICSISSPQRRTQLMAFFCKMLLKMEKTERVKKVIPSIGSERLRDYLWNELAQTYLNEGYVRSALDCLSQLSSKLRSEKLKELSFLYAKQGEKKLALEIIDHMEDPKQRQLLYTYLKKEERY